MLNCKNSPKLIARLNTRIINQLNCRGINIRIVGQFIPGEVSTELSVDGVREGLCHDNLFFCRHTFSLYRKKIMSQYQNQSAQVPPEVTG